MTLRLSSDRAAELEAIARAEERSVSDTVREAIDLLIEKKRKDKAFQARIRTMMDENQRVLKRLAH